MFVGFSAKLKHLSGIRFHFCSSKYAWLFILFIAMFYLIWYSIIAALWLIYGCLWIIVKPIELIIKVFKKE